nr:Hint domain-containing protein [Ancylobacter oerskovii]
MYATDSSGVILDSEVLQNATVTAADADLAPGDIAEVTVPSIGIDESLPYIGRFGNDMFFSIGGAERWLLSNNVYLPGEQIPINQAPYVLCFLSGTMIATPDGEVAIETLKAGDLVLTAQGAARPVRWLARQTVSTLFADPLKTMPVRIRAGALGEGLPKRDLYVSSDHALELDGLLVQAGALVNGTTIVRHTDMPSPLVYYHVELDDHSLILAEGVPAETFVDNVTRRRFDNWQEAPEAPVAEMDRPRIKSARQVPARIRDRIDARVPAAVAAA